MENILSDIMEFDVYKSSKDYVKSDANRYYSCKSQNYWKTPRQRYDPQTVKVLNTRQDHRLKISKVMSGFCTVYEEMIVSSDDVSPNIKIKLKDSIFYISKELKEIAEEIELSEELLDFKDNWDYSEALCVSPELYFSGINFLVIYSEFIFNSLGLVIQSPEINAGRKGNIYLSWRTDSARLAISIEKNLQEEIIAVYYGDLGNDKESIKGNVTVTKVSDYLAYWMKFLV